MVCFGTSTSLGLLYSRLGQSLSTISYDILHLPHIRNLALQLGCTLLTYMLLRKLLIFTTKLSASGCSISFMEAANSPGFPAEPRTGTADMIETSTLCFSALRNNKLADSAKIKTALRPQYRK